MAVSQGKKRNYGIDILRLISMFFIITLHTLYHGNVTAVSEAGSANYYISNLLITIVWSGVDIFAIISGFVGYTQNGSHRFKRFFLLWLRVVVYSGSISVVFYFCRPGSVNLIGVFKSFFPISNRTYWYFTSYVFVFLFSPVLNRLVEKCDHSSLKVLVIVGLGLLYLSHFLTGIFSIALLVYLYTLGAIIRKQRLFERISVKRGIVFAVIFYFLTWIWTVMLTPKSAFLGGVLLRYDSPTVIGAAAFLVMTFAKAQVTHVKTLAIITPSIFSLYLLNDHWLIRKAFIEDKFAWLSSASVLTMVMTILGVSACFCVIGFIIDFVRRYVEDELKIATLAEKAEALVNYISIKLCDFAAKILFGNGK